ncbi:N-formylglutamate amidohydrolase [Sphingorhabdus sp.]|uniref:N-formylglutamate amidohydrolase n=1 Tax=Sphingorhabdus sp. TaxID=1902408 RepID=UPI00359338F6
MTELPYRILGRPFRNGLLIVSDHASNHVPAGIDLGVDPKQLERHIAWDIGVAEVAEKIVADYPSAAILGNVSRLVVDLNRYPDEPDVIPVQSDGLFIPGNQLDLMGRMDRIARHFKPYHDMLDALIKDHRPALILSLHSFTPQLASRPDEQRPWELGLLYNEKEAPSKCAISFLDAAGINVGDQLPYSGKILNATMNRHAEGNEIPYVGIELRQDRVLENEGQERFARILTEMCHFVSEKLGLGLQKP